MKCDRLFSDDCRAVSSYLESSLNILASDKFDTFSSNFYQHQVILTRQKRCNLLIDRAHCCWLRSSTVSPAISVPKNKYDMQEKQKMRTRITTGDDC